MRKAQKQEVLEFINSLHQAHTEVKEALQQHNYDVVQNMLSECQEFAVALGESIEKTEGEGHITVSRVEEYCETLFRVFKEITDGQVNENKIYKILKRQLLNVENSVKNEITVKKEVVFFPYKASMWDSLESVYLAAKEDPECEAYCVPIPYFDLNPDHSFGVMHYEGNEYPEGIEITDWEKYNFEERRPDVIYIHNPYDGCNLVTSVHPRYYSSNLKKYTDTLVYIPYYVTSGGMLEAQSMLPAYLYADYIVIQSPQFREHFDENIPDEKFLPFGSPKIDKVINKCKNRPAPPAGWIQKLIDEDGRHRKVFFYNTSINGMLADTECFLKKMEYVFKCFEGREDVCLLWRPHPLLESTFDSMRPQYRQIYDALKQMFQDKDLGILDTTPDIADTIALSDAYIGDAGTSVTSLFGIAGKPIFILNNRIHNEPKEDDWRRETVIEFHSGEGDKLALVQGNKLYVSEAYKYDYKYFCDLPRDAYDRNHYQVLEINGKKYACSLYGQDIFVVGDYGVEERIELDKKIEIERGRAFNGICKYDKYLILIPLNYPAIVRYDTITGDIRYIENNIDTFIVEKENQKMIGGAVIRGGIMYIASLIDNKIYEWHIESGETKIVELPIQNRCGFSMLIKHENEIWGMPSVGKIITRWNPDSGETREYVLDLPEEFTCVHPVYGYKCEDNPFGIPAFYGQYMYLSPSWSNMYLKLNLDTGELGEWKPSYIKEKKEEKFPVTEQSTFIMNFNKENSSEFGIFSYLRRKLYSINMETEVCKEIEIRFDMEDLMKHEMGFSEYSEGSKYMCIENCFNSLVTFLDGKITGGQFDRGRQLAAYKKTAANSNGSCGYKIYEFVKNNTDGR